MASLASVIIGRINCVSHNHSGNGGGDAWSELIRLGVYIQEAGESLSTVEKTTVLAAYDSAIQSLFKRDFFLIQAFKVGPESLTYQLVSEFLDPHFISTIGQTPPDFDGFCFLDPLITNAA